MDFLIFIILGIFIGVILTFFIIKIVFSKQMILKYKSKLNFNETCQSLERNIENLKGQGWGYPIEKFNMYQLLEEKKQIPAGVNNIVVYFLCNAKYAKNVLESETKMSAMMPCAWSIYEKNDGNTYISKMNIGLMINFFSGVVKETMGNVEKTEKEILLDILTG